MNNFSDLKNRHLGEDIYVLGNGASSGLISKEFLRGKITIGINYGVYEYPFLTYCITRYHEVAAQLLADANRHDALVVCSRHQHGNTSNDVLTVCDERLVIFDHSNNCGLDSSSLVVPCEPQLVSSFSTITSAFHLAAYLGAQVCIVLGHDCGELDTVSYRPGYPNGSSGKAFVRFFPRFERQSVMVKGTLKERYGMEIYSLNPFINFGLEGHRYLSLTSSVNVPVLNVRMRRFRWRLALATSEFRFYSRVVPRGLWRRVRRFLARA